MKKLLHAGLFVAMASAFTPLAASAEVPSAQQNVVTSSSPTDVSAQMRDRSSYGSPSAGRMRTGMRGRSMMRSRMMMRRSMMRRDRMMMRRDRMMMRR